MMGTPRIAFMDGPKVGLARIAHNGRTHKPRFEGDSAVAKLPNLMKIKLSRAQVRSCHDGNSGAFSHGDDLESKRVIIWCTGDHGGFLSAFVGMVRRVSDAARPYVLVPERSLRRAEWHMLNT